jgi:hypothetical protein
MLSVLVLGRYPPAADGEYIFATDDTDEHREGSN